MRISRARTAKRSVDAEKLSRYLPSAFYCSCNKASKVSFDHLQPASLSETSRVATDFSPWLSAF